MTPLGDWRIWFCCTGRGWGKNRVLSEFIHDKAASWQPGEAGFLAARTLADVEKTIIGHPTSGLLVTQRTENPCVYKRHLGRLEWANGAYCETHSSEEPDRARGPHTAWGAADEVGTWKRVVDFRGNTAWDNLQMGLRCKTREPQMIAVTTPRPIPMIRKLLEDAKVAGSAVRLTTGTLYDNAENLAQSFVDYVTSEYEGTRLARQEIGGELLLDVEGAILTRDDLDASRVIEAPELARTVIGVDPALKSSKKSDKTGISVDSIGVDGDLYTLADRSCRMSPDAWSHRVVETCREFGTSTVAVETNVLGDAVETLIHQHDRSIRVIKKTAKQNKAKRAEPILACYERSARKARGDLGITGICAHIVGHQPAKEDQLVQFTPLTWEGDGSPDEADAHVWGASELLLGQSATFDQLIAVNA